MKFHEKHCLTVSLALLWLYFMKLFDLLSITFGMAHRSFIFTFHHQFINDGIIMSCERPTVSHQAQAPEALSSVLPAACCGI